MGLSKVSLKTANISVNYLKAGISKHCKVVMSMENFPYIFSIQIPMFVERFNVSMSPTTKFIPNCFETQEMCDESVRIEQCLLKFVLDYLKKQEMCNEAMCIRLASFFLISDCFETQEIST